MKGVVCCKKSVFAIVFGFVFTSCNLFNLHNVKNDFKWKNKKFSEKKEVQFLFNPIIVKEFDSTSMLKLYFSESNKIACIETVLKEKLLKRNFNLIESKSENVIVIDSLIFSDKVEMMSVLSNDASEILGEYEKNEIKLKIVGNLNIKGNLIKKISSKYEFVNEPREGYLIKGGIAYTNATINLDKVIANMLNKFSYECYNVFKEN